MAGSCARTEILVSQLGLAQLAESHVVIAGLGGVGGACAESLCRAGIGELTLIDFSQFFKESLDPFFIGLNTAQFTTPLRFNFSLLINLIKFLISLTFD